MTSPLRWLAKQFRALLEWLRGNSRKGAEGSDPSAPFAAVEPEETAPVDESFDFKTFFTGLYQIQLRSFLTAQTPLDLPRSGNPEISILLVLFNRAELTLACLRSLAENHTLGMEVIIVDNASSDETPLMLDQIRGARIVRNAENRNFVLAVNQAASEARGEYVLILNNDTQILPGALQAALATARTGGDIGAVGGRLILFDGSLQEAGSIVWRDGSCVGYGRGDNPFAPMYMFRRDVDYCSGAFLLTPRRLWQKLGGFDEVFKPAYYEETDYCTRLREEGFRIVYEPNAALLHYEFASSDSKESAIGLQRDHQQIFAARHQRLLAMHFAPGVNAILPARTKTEGRKRVLFIDDRVPHAWLGSGFPRSRAILHALIREKCFVTFYPLSVFDEDWRSIYSDMPAEVEFMAGYGPGLLEPFLRNRTKYYEVIFISRPHNMKILKPILDGHPEWFEETEIIYDAEAIFVRREITLRQLSGNPLPDEEAAAMLKEEMELAAAADSVVSVADSERPQFEKHGIERVHVLGHSLKPAATPNGFHNRRGFLFVGAVHEEASPNGDSVIWFLEEILAKIRMELGEDVPFTIAGVNQSDRIKQLAGASVRITGHLPDLGDLYNESRVFVAPTRYAAGIPHKIHEAAARGLPVVATPLLATQLGWQDDDVFLVGWDAMSFARKCIQLYTNQSTWTRLRAAALKRVEEECSEEAFEARVKEILKTRSARFADVGMDR